MNATVRRAGEGMVMDVMASRVTVRVPSEATGGTFSVVELQVPPGFRAPPVRHRHVDVDWWALVEEGEVAIELDGKVERVGAGGLVVVPRGVAFRWWNASDEGGARWVATYTPGGFERFFVEMVERVRSLGHPPTPADMATVAPELWARHGIEIA
jgi:mannose-6-phosphate isomerase-like protein (cupin superfamily)